MLLDRHDHPSELVLQAATAVHRGGRGTRVNVLAMELEIQRLYDHLDENRAAVVASTVALKRWVGSAANRPFSEPPHLDVPPPVEWSVREDLDAVLEITAAQHEVGLVGSEIRVAAQVKKPDVTVELMYSQRDPVFSNMGSVNISFPSPWDQGNRQDHEVAARLV